MNRLSNRDRVLLVLLTLAWGLNWPIMKLGVHGLPPFYYRSLCIGGGLVALWVYARVAGVPLAVPAGAWPRIVELAIPNAILWHVLLVVSLSMLPAGRSAILAYTMPIWAVVFGAFLFGEETEARHRFGIIAALVGIVLLLSSELTQLSGRPRGALLMLLAAAAWGYGTNLMRRRAPAMPTLAITFWMLVMTLVVVSLLSILFEAKAWRRPTAIEWGSIVYNMLLAIAFCHVVWAMLARRLPPAASGLSVMMIPVVGVFSSLAVLGERPRWPDYAALGSITIALSTVVLAPKKSG